MDLVFFHRLQGLLAVIGGDGAVALGSELNVQGGDDLFVVVADENGIHVRHLACDALIITYLSLREKREKI